MKISALIKALEAAKKKAGDIEVLIASDDEGNAYGKLGEVLDYEIDDNGNAIAIFPTEMVDPDSIAG